MGNSPIPSREGQGVGLKKAQDAAPSRILQFMFLYVLVPSLTGGVLWLLRAFLPPRVARRGAFFPHVWLGEEPSSPTGGSARGLLPPQLARRGALWLLRAYLPPRVARRGVFPPLESSPPRGELERGQGAWGPGALRRYLFADVDFGVLLDDTCIATAEHIVLDIGAVEEVDDCPYRGTELLNIQRRIASAGTEHITAVVCTTADNCTYRTTDINQVQRLATRTVDGFPLNIGLPRLIRVVGLTEIRCTDTTQ